jgi:UDP-N-acetylmuramoyl-L-alanyl-D-glutamate--2,6-diaminopimelate ligase
MQHKTQKLDLPEIWRVACHTDHVGHGTTFVAVRGQTTDGAEYIAQAIAKGATRVVVADDVQLADAAQRIIAEKSVELIRVKDTRLALAQLSAAAYDFPAQKLSIIGITGTKGKTTTAALLYHILTSAGIKAALISTVENKIGDHTFKAPLTTPQPDYLHMFFDVCAKNGVTHVVMEVAAQALTLHRVHGIQFDAGIFTNFSHEHLEFYQTMDDYFAAKCLLRSYMKRGAPIILNSDDAALQRFVYEHSVPISLHDIAVEHISPIEFTANIAGEMYSVLAPSVMGRFNIYNIVYALHCAHYLGIAKQDILQALATFSGVKGRLQKHELADGASCYIDYAHTPDSYMQVLSLLRSMTDHLIVVFGCGGLRDKSKRPIMGGIAASIADCVVLTSDNPRTEDPLEIIAQIKSGVATHDEHKIVEAPDRAQAIAYACARAPKKGIVAILGKGPDEYQIIGATRYYFSDAQTVATFNSSRQL